MRALPTAAAAASASAAVSSLARPVVGDEKEEVEEEEEEAGTGPGGTRPSPHDSAWPPSHAPLSPRPRRLGQGQLRCERPLALPTF